MGGKQEQALEVPVIAVRPPDPVDIHVLAPADVIQTRIVARDMARRIAMRRTHVTEFARAAGEAAQRLLELGGGHVRVEVVRRREHRGVSMTIEPSPSAGDADPKRLVDITAWEDGGMAGLWDRVDHLV